MDIGTLKVVAQVAGVAGIALAVFLTLYRDVIRKQIFPMLTRQQAFRLLTLVLVLVWTVALAGIGAWVWISLDKNKLVAADNPSPVPSEKIDHRLIGNWMVTLSGGLPKPVTEEIKKGQTKEDPGAKKQPDNDVEQSIKDLAKAFGGLADAASQSGSFALQLNDDSTYKVSETSGVFDQSNTGAVHIGRSGNWSFSQAESRLVLIPVGEGVAPSFTLTTIERNRLVDQGFGGRGCIFERQ